MSSETMKLYKFLMPNMESPFTGYQYQLGEWLPPVDGELVICRNGYHACRERDLLGWMEAELYVCEWRGDSVEWGNKVAVREIRLVRRVESWNEKNQRLFACDCAERVLHIYEKEYPDDSRVRNCLEVARQVANGKATLDELAAARAAAWAAAWDAAGNAAGAAARAAAWAAAGNAAGAAARAAAWDAARAAARDAAWAAAWAAARAAAWDAARAAARAAARVAAWDAEREWQHSRLLHYIGEDL